MSRHGDVSLLRCGGRFAFTLSAAIAALIPLLLGASCSSTPPPSPCAANGCSSSGAVQCSGDQVQTCAPTSDSCLGWSAAVPCPNGSACSAVTNACAALSQCATNGCTSSGGTQCSGAQVQTCAATSSNCLAWGVPTSCAGGSTCSPATGNCGALPQCATDGCPSPGGTRCSNSQVQTCAPTSDNCLAWGAAAPCPFGSSCSTATNNCTLPPNTLVFHGGTLDDLRALNPTRTLAFGNLVIDGKLGLVPGEAPTITASNLQITPI
jgi:hypothetical protein